MPLSSFYLDTLSRSISSSFTSGLENDNFNVIELVNNVFRTTQV